MKELIIFGSAFLIFLIGSPVTCMHYHSIHACERYGEVTKQQTKHASFSDCYIKKDGQFIHWTVYQNQNIGKNINL